MSVKIMGAIWDLDLPHEQAWVLMAYADHADHDGGNCYPAQELIAYKTNYSRRQVQYVTARLVEAGILVVDVPGRGRGHPTKYHIDISRASLKEKAQAVRRFPQTAQNEGLKCAEMAPKGAQNAQGQARFVREPLTVKPLTVMEEPNGAPPGPTWDRILQLLRLSLGATGLYRLYLQPAYGVLEGDVLRIVVPSQSGAEALRLRAAGRIGEVVRRVCGREIVVEICGPDGAEGDGDADA
jgi:hypothetical protein